jgi:hypothetical protein
METLMFLKGMLTMTPNRKCPPISFTVSKRKTSRETIFWVLWSRPKNEYANPSSPKIIANDTIAHNDFAVGIKDFIISLLLF